MAFSDPHLRSLKHQLKIQPSVELRSEMMALLIDRLEAAETYLWHLRFDEYPDSTKEAYEAWRKAKGE